MNYFTGDSDLNYTAEFGFGTPVIVDEQCLKNPHLVIDNHHGDSGCSTSTSSTSSTTNTEKYVCLGYLDNEGSACFYQCKPLQDNK